MLRYVTLIFMMLALCPAVFGSPAEWQWTIGQGYFAQFGTSASAQDGTDSADRVIASSQYYYYGVYHQQDTDGWLGDSGFYSADIRAPLCLVPGESKTWTFYLWADPSYPQGPAGDHLELSWGYTQPAPAFSDISYTLTYLASAHDVTDGGMLVGTSVNLNEHPQGTWRFPVYRTADGRTGYVFSLTATVVPEPSTFLALFTGIGGIGGLMWRRRTRS